MDDEEGHRIEREEDTEDWEAEMGGEHLRPSARARARARARAWWPENENKNTSGAEKGGQKEA